MVHICWDRVISIFHVKMLQINYGLMIIMHTIIVVFCKQQLERFLQSFLTTRRELLGMKLLTSWVCDSLIPARLYLQQEFTEWQACPETSVAYLIGLPIRGYSLDIGKEHVNLIDEQLQKLIYSGKLDGKELDRYFLYICLLVTIHCKFDYCAMHTCTNIARIK